MSWVRSAPNRSTEGSHRIQAFSPWQGSIGRRIWRTVFATVMRPLFFVAVFASIATAQQGPRPKAGLSLHTTEDYLALHLTGTTPMGASALEYRLAESGTAEGLPWLPMRVDLTRGGAFQWDLPLPAVGWTELQVRALNQGGELGKKTARPELRELELLTLPRIAALPPGEREAWTAYLETSAQRRAQELRVIAAECRELGLPMAKAAPGNSKEFEIDSDTPAAWFGGEEAGRWADAILSFQTPTGGWSKAVDYQRGPRQPGMHWTPNPDNPWHYCGTIDNRTTTEQVRFLAWVHAATGREDVKAASLRGLAYLLEAQYPNGGWPQNYPVEPGYHEAITLNDNALTHVLEILLQVQQTGPAFAFVDETLRRRAQAAYERGIKCLLKAHVKVDGRPTVWGAQHDPLTLAPVGARKKEPPSLSGAESTELLKFLMRKAPISEEITAAIGPAIAWLDGHRVTGLRKTKNPQGKTDYVSDPGSEEVYWARFYDVQTGKPMFAGSEDGILYATFSEMAAKNRVAYDYFTTKPGDLIKKEVPRWKKRLEKGE